MNQPLFRPEILARQQSQWLGTVLLAPSLSHRFFAAFAGIAVAAIVLLLVFASYTRKAHITGWLMPEQGLVRIAAPQPGVVTRVYIAEGTEVHQGQPLLALSAEMESLALGATQERVARGLAARHSSYAEERRQQKLLMNQQTNALAARARALRTELGQIDRELELQQSRLRFAEQSEARQRELRQRGFVSIAQLEQAQEATIDQAAKLRALERTRMTVTREKMAVEGELADLPVRFQARIAEIDRNMAELAQQQAEAEARREIVLTAPAPGVVTAIQAERGGRVATSVPLLSIVPSNAVLEAQMFSSGRAIGFIRPGQHVLMRYHAYPYQKFGQYEGIVSTISRTAINPAELPPVFAGLSALYGGNEPVYRISVRPASQAVLAYGTPTPLQAGMRVDADVVIERRRLIEWMFEPLFTITGKWQ